MNAVAQLSAVHVAAVVSNLPALPEIVLELLATIDQETASIDYLAGRLSRDQVLSAKVLRLANSSFYGFPGRVASVRDAMVVLGIRVVRSLVTAAGIAQRLPKPPAGQPAANEIWRHAFATATCARAIASAQSLDLEAAFTAGLIHDLGRLVLLVHFPAAYQAVREGARSDGSFLAEAERRVLGIDHAEVGYELALRWRLPEAIGVAVRDHHQTANASAASLADVVHVADVLVHALDLEASTDECVPPIDVGAWKRLAMTPERLPGLFKAIEGAWHDAELLTD